MLQSRSVIDQNMYRLRLLLGYRNIPQGGQMYKNMVRLCHEDVVLWKTGHEG